MEQLSQDGRLLVGLLLLVLLGPYLPILKSLQLVGITVEEGSADARLDNIAVPLVAAFLVLRSLMARRLILMPTLVLHVAFLVWLTFVTLLYISGLPGEYAGSETRGVALLRGFDAYIRPLLVLTIGIYARVTPHDLKMLIRVILFVGLIVGIIASIQLKESGEGPFNTFLFDYYDNNPGRQFWLVVNTGRVATIMAQLSTLGMYIVVVFGLLVAQAIGGRSISSPWVFGVLFGGAFLGGVLSGSKVFIAGTFLLGILLLLGIRTMRKDSLRLIVAAVIAVIVVWPVIQVGYPEQAERLLGRLSPDAVVSTEPPGDEDRFFLERVVPDVIKRAIEPFYDTYLGPRFDREDGKVYRTGAVDIAKDYPTTGLGLNVVNRTTDSMALGVFIMSGVVGSLLYLSMLLALSMRLFQISRLKSDPDVAATARVLLALTVVFLVVSIAFHTFIQDRAGDAYWLLAGVLIGPIAMHVSTLSSSTEGDLREGTTESHSDRWS